MDDATIAVVDEHNRFLRWANRQEVHGQHLPHRSVHVLLFTPEGHWIVQQRRHDKLTWPGHWDVAVAGHVERDDYLAGPDDELDAVYAAVAAREVSEELGIAPVLELVGAFPPEPGVHYEHLRLYRGVHPGPFLIQPEEVAAVQTVSPAAIGALRPSTLALQHWIARMGVAGDGPAGHVVARGGS